MIEICKILFDLCFYYTLSGYYLYIIMGVPPLGWGLPILMAPAIVCIILLKRKAAAKTTVKGSREVALPVVIVCCLLPGSILAFRPGIWQIVQFIPAWAHLGFTLWDNRIYTDRGEFSRHFGFTGKLLISMVAGFFVFSRIGVAITIATPYFILYLLSGVCLMRILREEGKLTVSRNISVLLILLFGSIALVFLQMPQLLLSVIGFIYQNIIARILIVAAYVVGAVFLAIVWFFRLIFGSRDFGDNAPPEIDTGPGTQEIFGGADAVLREIPQWIEMVFTVLVVLAVIFVLILILRRLLGDKKKEKTVRLYTEEREKLHTRDRSRKGGVLRPKDPRLAVRWYYRKYLKEGIHRGVHPEPGDTSLRLLRKHSAVFSKNEAGKLREIYVKARYRNSGEIQKSDADLASDLWRSLKHQHYKSLK